MTVRGVSIYGEEERGWHMTPAAWTALVLAAVAAGIWTWSPLADMATIENATAILRKAKHSHYASLSTFVFFALSSSVLFPVTILTGACVIVFGPLKGLAISYAGAMAGGMIGYAIGRGFGMKRLEKLFGRKIKQAMLAFRSTGITGIAVVRMLPIAPYPISNMAFGVMETRLWKYILGTALGLLPCTLAMLLVSDFVIGALRHPTPLNILYLGALTLAWTGVALAAHRLAQHWQKSAV